VTIDPAQVRRAHQALLERWRGAMNLVGPGPTDLHFEDSEAVARLLQAQGRWADLGSGAGFPGVAVATWNPASQVTLVESRQKRAAFLTQVLRAADLPNAAVYHGRVEALPEGAWDGVVSRAFAPPPLFLQHARRLLAPGGRAALLLARGGPTDFPGLTLQSLQTYRAGGRNRRLALYLRLADNGL